MVTDTASDPSPEASANRPVPPVMVVVPVPVTTVPADGVGTMPNMSPEYDAYSLSPLAAVNVAVPTK